MGRFIVCISGRKLCGQLRMVIVYMFVCVCVSVLEELMGGCYLSFAERTESWLSWKALLHTSSCEQKQNKMKDTAIALPCCLYHSATRMHMQSTDEKLNHVYKWGEGVCEAAFAVLI